MPCRSRCGTIFQTFLWHPTVCAARSEALVLPCSLMVLSAQTLAPSQSASLRSSLPKPNQLLSTATESPDEHAMNPFLSPLLPPIRLKRIKAKTCCVSFENTPRNVRISQFLGFRELFTETYAPVLGGLLKGWHLALPVLHS